MEKIMNKEDFRRVVTNMLNSSEASMSYNNSSTQSEFIEAVGQHDPKLAQLIRANHATIGTIIDHLRRRLDETTGDR